MASSNVKARGTHRQKTHEGGAAVAHTSPLDGLRRVITTAMLGENSFYERGQLIQGRIAELVGQVSETDTLEVADMVREAKDAGMRHTPIFVAVSLFERRASCAELALRYALRRADEPAEVLSLWFAKGRRPIPRGMRRAINAFLATQSAYQLAKYRGASKQFKLRDVIRLCHPVPADNQGLLYKGVIDDTLPTPETWETQISAARGDKAKRREIWRDLLRRSELGRPKMGGLALLRNLRNMVEDQVPNEEIRAAIAENDFRYVFPYQFFAAADACPGMSAELEAAMLRCLRSTQTLPGHTILLVDVSVSMGGVISSRSVMKRVDAAAGMATICRESCESVEIVAFSNDVTPIPNHFRGFALREKICSLPRYGTDLATAVASVGPCDRLVVFTDEQSRSTPMHSSKHRRVYVNNVAPERPEVQYEQAIRINGFSERLVDFIHAIESSED